jgi:hypothetical protein
MKDRKKEQSDFERLHLENTCVQVLSVQDICMTELLKQSFSFRVALGFKV